MTFNTEKRIFARNILMWHVHYKAMLKVLRSQILGEGEFNSSVDKIEIEVSKAAVIIHRVLNY